jgi:hypothetical protein
MALKKEVAKFQIICFFKRMVMLLFILKAKKLRVQKIRLKDYMLLVCLISNLYKIKVKFQAIMEKWNLLFDKVLASFKIIKH